MRSKEECLARLNNKAKKRALEGIDPRPISSPIKRDPNEPVYLRLERDRLNADFFASHPNKRVKIELA